MCGVCICPSTRFAHGDAWTMEGSKLTAMFGCNYTVQGLIMYGEAWFGL